MFGVSSLKLQEYCTSEKDLMRQINRMPNDDYMLDVTGDGTVKKPEKQLKEGDMDGLEQEIDDFFDFVIIDQDMYNRNPKNKTAIQKKIVNEQETMEAGTAEMILDASSVRQSTKGDGEPDAYNNEVKLEDFKIKKVIDKGSFGKVFLVVHTKTGRELAMKRINKDILIEKGQIINTKTEKDILFQAKNPFILSMEYVF